MMSGCCCCCWLPLLTAVLASTAAGATSSPSWFRFTQPVYNASIAENAPPRSYVTPDQPGMGIHVGYDPVAPGPAHVVAYSIRRSRASRLFRPESKCVGDFCFLFVRTRSGKHAALNREQTDSYRLTVEATVRGRGRPPLSARAELVVNVVDVNDLSPLFDVADYHVTVAENASLHQSVATVTASDADVGVNGEVYYGLAEASDTFAVHPTSGVVTLTRRLNALDRADYELTVTARDRGPTLRGVARLSRARLHVTVTSENLHAPEIGVRRMPAVTEHGAVGTVYAIVRVRDRDYGRNGHVDAVTIVDGDPDGHFAVRRSPGDVDGSEFTVVVVRVLDRERHADGFNLTLAAVDRGRPPRTGSTVVSVKLQDVNDNAPVFASSAFVVNVSECLPVGTPVAYLAAADADTEDNGRVTYSVLDHDGGLLDVGSASGTLRVAAELDAETTASVELTVAATDHGHAASRRRQTARVTVNVVDCNDNAPVLGRVPSVVTVDENSPSGSAVFDVDAEDADSGDNGFVSYSLANGDAVPFTINPFTGLIATKQSFDFETMRRDYDLLVRASDWGSPFRRDVEAVLRVRVRDLNDNRPQFEQTNCSGFVYRDAAPRTRLVRLSALDFDADDVVTYRIDSGNDDDCFEVGSQTGLLRTKSCSVGLSGSHLETRVIVVAATDGQHQSKVAVTVNLLRNPRHRNLAGRDANVVCGDTGVASELRGIVDQQRRASRGPNSGSGPASNDVEPNHFSRNLNSPRFPATTPRRLRVREGSGVRRMATLRAVDDDRGYNGRLLYVISDGNDDDAFRADTESGELFAMGPLDRERRDRYRLNVSVCDMGTPRRCSWLALQVDVDDVNDNAPVFERRSYVVSVSEDAPVNTVLTSVSASDRDLGDNGRLVYRLASRSDVFSINSATGQVRVAAALDRETTAVHELSILAVDRSRRSPPLSGTATLTVRVDDVNDNAPVFVPPDYRVRLLEDMPVGTVVGSVLAVDPDAGNNGAVRYAIVDGDDDGGGGGYFDVDRVTGVVRLTHPVSFREHETFNLTLRARDRAAQSPLASTTTMIVDLVPVSRNLHAPLFSDFVLQARVRENQPAGTSVMPVVAADDDVDNPAASSMDYHVVYSIRNGTGLGRFSIDSKGTDLSLIHI